MNWQELATSSHYQTAVAVGNALKQGEVAHATAGIQELIEALSRADRRALQSQLIRLMSHIFKWQSQPENRSANWRSSIRNARAEIADLQEETPSLNRQAIEKMWSRCLNRARADAEDEMGIAPVLEQLSWQEVFENDYELV